MVIGTVCTPSIERWSNVAQDLCSASVRSDVTGKLVSVGSIFKPVEVVLAGEAVAFAAAGDPEATIKVTESHNGSNQVFVNVKVPSLATDVSLAASYGSKRIGTNSSLGHYEFSVSCSLK